MIKIIQGDIMTLAMDAIVNAANQVMLGNAPKRLVSEGNFERSEGAQAVARRRWRCDSSCGKSIAFPCISTGVYGYPIEDAAKIALREVKVFLAVKNAKDVEELDIIFCCFSESDKRVYYSFGWSFPKQLIKIWTVNGLKTMRFQPFFFWHWYCYICVYEKRWR